MKKYNQLVTSGKIGDCFRACMATLLQLPPEVLPNDHSPAWPSTWHAFLSQFGLDIMSSHSKGAIWVDGYWIASVKSLNYEENTHAIVMHDTHRVYHDPSNKKRYKTGASLIGKDTVIAGHHLIVTDTTLLHRLEDYRQKIVPLKDKDVSNG
jgi:hypothetical protein